MSASYSRPAAAAAIAKSSSIVSDGFGFASMTTTAGTCTVAGNCVLGGAATQNVASVTGATATGQITIVYTAAVTGNTVMLWPSSNGAILAAGTPPGGPIAWDCYALNKTLINGATAAGTMLPKYTPANCRT